MSERNPSINPNHANLKELTLLPGVGEALAQRIMEQRPFTAIEDMRRVPGLGAVTLERMRPMLALDVQEQVSTELNEASRAEVASEMKGDEYAKSERAAEALVTRSQVLGISAAVAGVGVIISILLVLSIFIGINRTLNYSRHSAVRELIGNVDQLEDQLEVIDTTLSGVDRRLAALEGLSGRMTTLENELAALDTEVQAATSQVEQMRTRLEEASLQIEELARQSENQATFFERLQELLNELFASPVEENAG